MLIVSLPAFVVNVPILVIFDDHFHSSTFVNLTIISIKNSVYYKKQKQYSNNNQLAINMVINIDLTNKNINNINNIIAIYTDTNKKRCTIHLTCVEL